MRNFMRRSLIYFWQIHLAVLLGAAVATATLTGALLVGDSVRGSLRDLTVERLGQIDDALVSDRFFREELATDLSNEPKPALEQSEGVKQQFRDVAPAILLRGAAINANTKSRASRIQIHGIDQRFTALFDHPPDNGTASLSELDGAMEQSPFPPIVINESLNRELNAEIGAPILISFEKRSDIHRESLLGSRDASDVVQTLRLTLTHIIPDRGIGRFGLRPHQNFPPNAYVALSVLQKALGQRGQVNALFVSKVDLHPDLIAVSPLQNILRQVLKLEDLGLVFRQNGSYFSLESRELVLKPSIVEIAETVATQLNAPSLPVLTYLANTITANGRTIPYSTITALNTSVGEPFGPLTLTNGLPAPRLADDEILLNEWAADELGANLGDAIDVSYYVVGPQEQLLTKQAQFRLKGILALKGLAADPHLTPEFPGIQDADDISAWHPPFPMELNRIRPKDEAYWDEFGATPKAFVSEEMGQRLWSSRFGNLTAIRIGAAPGTNLQTTQANFQKGLLEKILPEQVGLVFQPVKAQGLKSASGSTDFSMLFIGFSLFLIVSAALLVGLLFRLGVEQRASEIGMLLSVGYPIATVRRRFMKEGGLLAGIGGVIGSGLALIYAWLLMVGLRTWWAAAVGMVGARHASPPLFLHINVGSLVIGYAIAMGVVLFSIGWSIRQFAKVPTPALLAGGRDATGLCSTDKKATPPSRGGTQGIVPDSPPWTGGVGRWVRILAFAASGIAGALIVFALLSHTLSSAGLFFGSGALLLIAGLAFLSLWFQRGHRKHRRNEGFAMIARMGVRNSARHPGRSMLNVALIGCACFVIVAVGANRREAKGVNESQGAMNHPPPGAGGFSLVAESDIPLYHDLNSEAGRFELGFSESASEIMKGAEVVPLRLMPGDDASCLNLYRPQTPRILGVPAGQLDPGGFQFQGRTTTSPGTLTDASPVHGGEPRASPGSPPWRGGDPGDAWHLLEGEIEPGVIPAIGDYNSVLWILHLGLGKDLSIQDGLGHEFKLRLVGLLQSSLFQSELLISEANFIKHFPNQSGYSYFLIKTPVGVAAGKIAQTLESTLSDYGFDTTLTAEKLANYQAVENTYLSTFQMLGGLGLLLGTLGLGIVLFRNVIERGGELATLRAFGFRRSTLVTMLLAENGFTLVIGMLIGSLSALVAVGPHLMGSSAHVPWLSLAITLIAVLFVGMIASAAAVSAVLRTPLLPALKAE